jgi:actin-related protein
MSSMSTMLILLCDGSGVHKMSASNLKPPVVLDNGTGYTKMGYAGNYEPNFIVPSLIANAVEKRGERKSDVFDLDFYIGNEAASRTTGGQYNIDYPIRHGIVDNWDNMEKYVTHYIVIIIDIEKIGWMVLMVTDWLIV